MFGDENVYEDFNSGVQQQSNSLLIDDIKEELIPQVKEDLDKFATRLKLSNNENQHQFNVKQIVYRCTTLFISALASFKQYPMHVVF